MRKRDSPNSWLSPARLRLYATGGLVGVCLLAGPSLAPAAQPDARTEESNPPAAAAEQGVTPANHNSRLEAQRNPRSNGEPSGASAQTGRVLVQPDWIAQLYDELDQAAQREQALRHQIRSLHSQLADARQANDALTAALTAEREASAAIRSAQAVLDSRLAVAESAQAALGQELAAARGEITRLQRRVAFFERLVPDGNEGNRISIRSAEVHSLGSNLVQYRVLVMRHGPAHEPFEGTLQFVATGNHDGSSATIPLERLATAPTSESGASAQAEAAGLNFQQYQRASGLLAIPPGFEPATITVRVIQGKAVKAEHTMTLAKELPK